MQFPAQTVHPDIERSNTRHLYIELAWMAIAFAMEWYYLQVYAIRLGLNPPHLDMITSTRALMLATSTGTTALHLGILSSGRALMLAIGSGLAHVWQSRFINVIRAISMPLIVSRFLLYMTIALVPLLPSGRIEALVALVVLSGVPQGIAQGVFLGMVPAALNKESLARVVSNRSVLMNASILLCMGILGQFLEWLPMPLNYQIGFGMAFVAGFMSWWNIRKIVTPNVDRTPKADQPRMPRTNVWKYVPFRNFAIVLVVINISVFMAGPLVQLHWVRGLGATDSWISIFGIFEMGAGALLTLRVSWLIKKFGVQKLIIATTLATALQMVIFALTPVLPPVLIGQVLFGAGWFAVNVLLYNRLVEIVPSEHVAEYASMYQMLVNFSLFLGPLIGTFLIDNLMTIPMALLLIGGLRFLAALMAWAVRAEPEPVAVAPTPAIEIAS